MLRWWRSASIATRLFVQAAVLITLAGAAAFALLAVDARRVLEREAGATSSEIAQAIAATPTIKTELAAAFDGFDEDPDASVARAQAALQEYVSAVDAATRVEFITVMHPSGIRYTHPDGAQIGKQFLGTREPALAGSTFTEIYEGTLGPSVRAVTPVVVDGEVVGLVSAGVTIASVGALVTERLVAVGALLVAALLVAAAVAWFLARRIDRATGGRRPEDLARLFDAHEALLHSVDDGLLLVEHGEVVFANDRARTLLGADAGDGLESEHIRETATRLLQADGQVRVGERWLLVERNEAGSGRTTITVRDRTEFQEMTGELDAVRTLAAALRAQTHEFGNRMHTVATLIELGEPDEALGVATAGRALGQRLADRVVADHEEPVIAALLLGKAAQAHERSVEMHVETHLEPGTHGLDPVDFVTVLGNLVDNAIDAAAERAASTLDAGETVPAWVEVYLDDDDGQIVLQVTDSGPGVPDVHRVEVFTPGWTTKSAGEHGRGFGLSIVRKTVDRLGGTIEISDADPTAGGSGAVVTVMLPRPKVAA